MFYVQSLARLALCLFAEIIEKTTTTQESVNF